jgi:cell division septation protein DedD
MVAQIKTTFWAFALIVSTVIPWMHIREENASRISTKQSPSEQTKLVRSLGAMPMGFEENRGQTSPQVSYVARGYGYTLFLCPTEAVMRLKRNEKDRSKRRHPDTTLSKTSERSDEVVRMKLVGANPRSRAERKNQQPGRCNYFKGNDPSRWVKDVSRYSKVRFRDVYPGIDMVYYGNGGRLEYDLVVKPGADPNAIRLRFEGAGRLSLDGNGDVKTEAGGEGVVLKAPILYEEGWFGRKPLDGRFALVGKDEVRFEVGDHDRTRTLVLDPVLDYSTYLGGTGEETASGIAVDALGNAYVVGETTSTDFPTQAALQSSNTAFYDVFISKIDATGTTLVYSTYLGGNGNEFGHGIAVDGSGDAYVTGYTNSVDFPTKNPIQSACAGNADCFVTKLNASGSALVYSTYLGGAYSETGSGIALDASGNAYVAGYTASDDFPTVSPIQASRAGNSDVFLVKLNAMGTSLIYSTYLGGTYSDYGTGIAVDGSGNAYVSGYTYSDNFPTKNAYQSVRRGVNNAFVFKVDMTGTALVYSTYLGGTGNDGANAIAVDGSGDAFVTGFTNSSDFPTVSPVQGALAGTQNAFVTKFNAAGSALVYSTYLGGSASENSFGIAVDGNENAYVTGYTTSTDYPLQNAIQLVNRGSQDVLVTKLDAAGSSWLYSTYLGGSGADVGYGIAVDALGRVYVTGNTPSTDFPTKVPLQPSKGAGFNYDGFVLRIAGTPLPTATATDTATPTVTPTNTPTSLPSSSPTATVTMTSSATPTPTPAATSTVIPFPTPIPGCFYVSLNAMKASTGSDVAVLFCTSQNGRADLTVYNTAGETIRVLFGGPVSPGGQYQASWDGKNKSGQNVASGVYLLHLKLPDSVRVAKVAVIR